MIYLLADLHGDFRIFTKSVRKQSKYQLTKNDCVIILGDFGLGMSDNKEFEYNCKWLSSLPCTILFIDGDYENYDMLARYPVETWHGGKVHHIVKDKIIHLMRGQIFCIENFSFFVMGGAVSYDIEGGLLNRSDTDLERKKALAQKSNLNYRTVGENWWSQELPSQREYAEGLRNLAKADFKVDFILSHCTPKAQQEILIEQGELKRKLEVSSLTEYFEYLDEQVSYKHWFCGHVHKDAVMDVKHTVVYLQLVPLNKLAALMQIISQDAMEMEMKEKYGNTD